jgi:hypothetical protein
MAVRLNSSRWPSRRSRRASATFHQRRPKPTDNRGAHFSDTETWQAEALDPNDLADILEAAIVAQIDPDIRNAVLAEEAALRQALGRRFGFEGGDQ